MEAAAADADPDLHDDVRHEGRGARSRRQDQRRAHADQRRRPRHRASPTTPWTPSCCSTSTRAWSIRRCCSRSSPSARSTTQAVSDSTKSRCSPPNSAWFRARRSRPTVPALRAWLADFEDRGDLQVTDGARRVLDLFFEPPPEAEWRPVLRGVSRMAYGTLPDGIREMYGLPFGPVKRAAMRATFPAIRAARPLAAAEVPVHPALPGLHAASAGHRTGRRGRPGAEAGGHPPLAQGPSLVVGDCRPWGRSTSTGCCSTSTACW